MAYGKLAPAAGGGYEAVLYPLNGSGMDTFCANIHQDYDSGNCNSNLLMNQCSSSLISKQTVNA
jgi:hypothetical protein